MKKIFYRVVVISLFMISWSAVHSAFGQANVRIFHDTTQHPRSFDRKYLGRDLWFCIPQNLASNSKNDQYYHVYVTSDKTTTVHFQVQGKPEVKKPLPKNTVIDFSAFSNYPSDFTVGAEITTSGQVEQEKGIHVWSNDADISVYLLSRAPASTDGMYVVPVTGWGTEYVVSSYIGVFDQFGTEWPSEFAIIANQDGTHVRITPTWDIRQNGQSTVAEFQQGQPFVVNLNKGECVQYQATDVDISEDLTGTYISSDKPIGLIGASAGPYIPAPWVNPGIPGQQSTCCGDLVMDMMQPTRTWSNSYFTIPFANRKYTGDLFLVVGTKPGQIVNRNGAQAAVLAKPFDFLYLYDVHGESKWSSTDPFMLVQYMEGDWWDEEEKSRPQPTNPNDQHGDPCSVVVNGSDQFTRKVIFQTPVIQTQKTQEVTFQNFVNLILPHSHIAKTTFDNVSLINPLSIPNVQKVVTFPNINNTGWDGYQIWFKRPLGEGTHTVLSDTGVGVYIYGQAQDESYAWSGSLGISAVNDHDSIPPLAVASGPCFCAHVAVTDPLPGSKLQSIDIDSSFNMTFVLDTTFVPGRDTSFYDLCIVDSSQEAYLSVIIQDIAGNWTEVVSHYKPANIVITPVNFGTENVGNTAFKYDTICNTGSAPFTFIGANLNFQSSGTKTNPAYGFTIDSIGADGVIPPGGCRVIKLKFSPLLQPTVSDTVVLTDACLKAIAKTIGNGGQPDFDIGNYTFDCTGLNSHRKSVGYFITNPSGIDVTVDSIWIDPNPNFAFLSSDPGNTVPLVIPNSNTASGQAEIIVRFNPQKPGYDTVIIHVRVLLPGGKHVEKSDTIFGRACTPYETRDSASTNTTCTNSQLLTLMVINSGNYPDTLSKITANPNDPGFTVISVKDSNSNVITPPIILRVRDTIYVSVQYNPASGKSGCFTDSVIVIGTNGPIEPAPYFTVCVKDIAGAINKDVNFGTLQTGSAKVSDFMEICNTGTDIMRVDSVKPFANSDPSIVLNGTFKVAGAIRTLPVNLNSGECLDIYVQFDPALNTNAYRLDSFWVYTNACQAPTKIATADGSLSNAVPGLQGFTGPATFSCDSYHDSVTFTNLSLVAGKITQISISGPDASNFASAEIPPVTGIPVAGKGVHKTQINFTPTPQAGTRPYNATVTFTFDDGSGPKPYPASVSATGQGMDLTVTSQFANTMIQANPGFDVTLPVQLSINKHSLPNPLSEENITKIRLTYIYNTAILDIGNLASAVAFPNGSQWTLDAANSSLPTPANNTLKIAFIRKTGVLSDADITQPLANITFKPTVSDSGAGVTNVKLTNAELLDSLNNPLSPCVSVARKDSNFTLIYLCGDSILQNFMLNGTFPMRAEPVKPNPSSGAVSFKYAMTREGLVRLSIFDALGKEVARVIDGQTFPAGAYEAKFNASGLAAGTYIFRFTLDNSATTSGRFVIEK